MVHVFTDTHNYISQLQISLNGNYDRYSTHLDNGGFEQEEAALRHHEAREEEEEDADEHTEAQELDEALETLAHADALLRNHLRDVPQSPVPRRNDNVRNISINGAINQ